MEGVMANYSPPVSDLMRIGPIDWKSDWLDYRHFGLTLDNVAELGRLAADPVWLQAGADEGLADAPIHAWRALAQLGAVDQLPVVLQQMRLSDCEAGGDLITEEFPPLLACFGPAAIATLIDVLNDGTDGMWARITARGALEEIARDHPDHRDRIVAALTGALDRSEAASPEVNAFIVDSLLNLKAVEAAPVVEQVFAAGAVDEFVAGDWAEVQFAFGLGPEPPPRRGRASRLAADPNRPSPRDRAKVRKAERKRRKRAQKRNHHRR
jgi:hypothetical protein